MNVALNITVPVELQQRIINFVNTSNSAGWIPWDYEVSIDSDNLTLRDRGRKLTYVNLHDDIADDVNRFAQLVFEHYLDPNYSYPIPVSDIKTKSQGIKHIPHMISVLFKDQKKTVGIQKHTDPRDERGWWHVRFNFMIQSSEGGEPVILSTVHDVKEGSGWLCISSEWEHCALPVTGDKERIILSLGYYVEPNYASQMYKRFF